MDNSPKKKLTMEDLNKLTVLGEAGLRRLIVKNGIVINKIAKAKRAELVNAIIKSDWWKDNGTPIANSNEEKKEEKEEKDGREEKADTPPETQKSILMGEVEKCINEKNDLRKEIRELENRIKNKDLTIKEGEKMAEKVAEKMTEKEKEKQERKEKKKTKKESKKDKKREELQAELDAKINEIDTMTKANNINIDKEDLILKQIRKDVEEDNQLDEISRKRNYTFITYPTSRRFNIS